MPKKHPCQQKKYPGWLKKTAVDVYKRQVGGKLLLNIAFHRLFFAGIFRCGGSVCHTLCRFFVRFVRFVKKRCLRVFHLCQKIACLLYTSSLCRR